MELHSETKFRNSYRNTKLSRTKQGKTDNVRHLIKKLNRHAKQNSKVLSTIRKKNKYTKTDPKLTQMLELADKVIKTHYCSILCVQRARGKIMHVKKRYERY